MKCALCNSEAYKKIKVKRIGIMIPICKNCEKLRGLWLRGFKK
jgi:transposase-like protein